MKGANYGIFEVFFVNFICVAIAIKLLEIAHQLNVVTALLSILFMWGIPTWRWIICLWTLPVKEMKMHLLVEVHDSWTRGSGFRGGHYLSKVTRSDNSVKALRARQRVLDLKRELLLRYESQGMLNNSDLISSIKALERALALG
ncbi:MAG: hypothetical protein WC733_04530 [Methylophilus sp.]